MGFDIYYNWQATSADPEAQNEALAAALLSRFSSLRRVPLDLDAIAKSIDVPRNEILAHSCQVELDAEGGEIGQAIITLWLDFLAIAVPSRPEVGIEAKLQCLESLFDTLTAAGLASDPACDLAKNINCSSLASNTSRVSSARAEITTRCIRPARGNL